MSRVTHALVRITGTTVNDENITATAFIYKHVTEQQSLLFLVMNAHTIHEVEFIEATFSAGLNDKPVTNKTVTIKIPTNSSDWFLHPDKNVDLCICSFNKYLISTTFNGNPIYALTLSEDAMIEDSDLQDLTAVEEVLIVGYPNGVYDEYNNKPIFKRGITATDIALDYQGYAEFLVDAAVYKGSSGSPVFISEIGFYKKGNTLNAGNRFLLAGILYSVYEATYEGKIINTLNPKSNIPTVSRTEVPFQLSGVIKIKRLVEIIGLYMSGRANISASLVQIQKNKFEAE